jgi:hypothetical protein
MELYNEMCFKYLIVFKYGEEGSSSYLVGTLNKSMFFFPFIHHMEIRKRGEGYYIPEMV